MQGHDKKLPFSFFFTLDLEDHYKDLLYLYLLTGLKGYKLGSPRLPLNHVERGAADRSRNLLQAP